MKGPYDGYDSSLSRLPCDPYNQRDHLTDQPDEECVIASQSQYLDVQLFEVSDAYDPPPYDHLEINGVKYGFNDNNAEPIGVIPTTDILWKTNSVNTYNTKGFKLCAAPFPPPSPPPPPPPPLAYAGPTPGCCRGPAYTGALGQAVTPDGWSMEVSDTDVDDPAAYEPVIAACMAHCNDRADCHAIDLKRPAAVAPAVVCTLYTVPIPEDGHGNNNHADGCGDTDVSFASHHEADPRCYVKVGLNAQLRCGAAFLGDANPLVLDGNQNAHTDFTLFAGSPPMPPMADVRGPAGNEAFHLSFEFAAYPFAGEQYLVSWVDNAGLRVQISLLDTDCSNGPARLAFKVLYGDGGTALFGGSTMDAAHSHVFKFEEVCGTDPANPNPTFPEPPAFDGIAYYKVGFHFDAHAYSAEGENMSPAAAIAEGREIFMARAEFSDQFDSVTAEITEAHVVDGSGTNPVENLFKPSGPYNPNAFYMRRSSSNDDPPSNYIDIKVTGTGSLFGEDINNIEMCGVHVTHLFGPLDSDLIA